MIEILHDSTNGYRYHIKAQSGNILFNSIPYSTRQKAEQAVNDLRGMQITRNQFERKTDHEGRFLFYIYDKQGKLLGDSQLYDSEMGLENGIKNLLQQFAKL
ncbi:YegP family protein [Pareuzebyella sediminis]|uniref:YegP family protein n=1 Tax=Pareuzebyella sediminis TaxID=2607998 RepID=UPI0011EEB398|nr:DUF1508 domain-containing protein [Pareuzebyella sediminis]